MFLMKLLAVLFISIIMLSGCSTKSWTINGYNGEENRKYSVDYAY